MSCSLIVESNFVLEIVLEQEQAHACHELLRLARLGTIKLVIPAYSMMEPYETLFRRHRQRKNLQTDLGKELKQLSRSTSAASMEPASSEVLALLINSANHETNRIAQTRTDLLDLAQIVPLTDTVVREAEQYQRNHDLSPQDAVVYASVLTFLRNASGNESIFVSRDSRAFDDPDIRSEVQSFNCKVFSRFDTAVGYLNRA